MNCLRQPDGQLHGTGVGFEMRAGPGRGLLSKQKWPRGKEEWGHQSILTRLDRACTMGPVELSPCQWDGFICVCSAGRKLFGGPKHTVLAIWASGFCSGACIISHSIFWHPRGRQQQFVLRLPANKGELAPPSLAPKQNGPVRLFTRSLNSNESVSGVAKEAQWSGPTCGLLGNIRLHCYYHCHFATLTQYISLQAPFRLANVCVFFFLYSCHPAPVKHTTQRLGPRN